MSHYDVVIVGAGIAGASLASELAPSRSVLLIEAEATPGYHTTGRSNAIWQATYGGPGVEPLTTASRSWLQNPPSDFSDTGFLAPRGTLMIARDGDAPAVDAFFASFASRSVGLERIDQPALKARLPGVRSQWTSGIFEAASADIDVASLHAAYLGDARRHGATIITSAALTSAHRRAGVWSITTSSGEATADTLANAAGAWADQVATLAGARPLGIQPFRRTITQIAVDFDVPPDLPLINDINGAFYFRPERGRVWLSPHDETPSVACDAAPEELDIAIAIDRFEQVVDWPVRRVEHSWAGLRSFAPDRLPVYGFDPDCTGFFWFAGQGGFGIQTAPAAAKLAASLITARSPDVLVRDIDPAHYAPGRIAA